MGFIKEPKGIDLNVKSVPLTEQDRKQISNVIAQYKLTGKKPSKSRKLSSDKKKLKTSP
jgi:hypothetical protein